MQNKKFHAGRFAGKGYYIALILCAIAIGVSGYLYYNNQKDPSMENPNATVDVLGTNASIGTQRPSQATAGGDTVGTQPTTPSTPIVPTPMPIKTGKPVDGQVLLDYSMDMLCYNPTTRDWRTHDGMDIAAEAGTQVLAAAAGTVYTVFQDDRMGYTVVIRHQDGYVTTYSSLSEDVQVKAGDVVVLGQTIGYAASTALLESALGDHVHFSVSCNGKPMDPEAFFALS